MIISIFGYVAAACTTISFVPQALKVYKTKSTGDISLGMFLLMTAGVVLWIMYGLLINSIPLIAANVVTFILSLYILIMKVRFDIIQFKQQEKH